IFRALLASSRSRGGGCQPAGVPPEACGEGFTADGAQGCRAVLPAQPCGAGEMAVPGEAACHRVAVCSVGTWGASPVDPEPVDVDGSYAGGDSDGSAAHPFATIGDAYIAAKPNATIAIAAGTYTEELDFEFKPVHLWGVCPDQVTLVGTGSKP